MNPSSPDPAARVVFDRPRVAAIAAAIACVTAVGIGLSLSIPLLSLEMERMGVSGTLIGVNTAIAGIASICIVPFVPRLAARVGVLPLLWICIVVGALSLPAFNALYSFAWWFPLRFVFSAALGSLFVLSEFWINAAAPPHQRGLVMGVYATVLALGFAAGPGLLALAGTSGWPPYLAGGALFALAGVPLLFARGLSPDVGGGTGRSVFSFVLAAPSATIGALVFGAAETGGFALLPVYGLQLGFDAAAAAFLVSIVALGNVAFQVPVGLLSDRVDRRRLLLVLAVVGLLGAAVIPAAGNPLALYTVLFIWGGVTGALYTVGLAHLGARFVGGDLASANAAFILLYNVGLVIGPPAVGAGMDALPPHGFPFSLAAFFAVYVAVLVWRIASSRRVLTAHGASGIEG
jgi:MFS family permease